MEKLFALLVNVCAGVFFCYRTWKMKPQIIVKEKRLKPNEAKLELVCDDKHFTLSYQNTHEEALPQILQSFIEEIKDRERKRNEPGKRYFRRASVSGIKIDPCN